MIHPQYATDRKLLTGIIEDGRSSDINLVEVARLRIRHKGFPGALDIQQDLDAILDSWFLTEEELFQRTRKIHARGDVYKTVL